MSNFASDKITQQEIQIELKKDGDVIENLLLKEQSLTDVKEVKELSGCAKSFNSIKGYSLGLLYALLTCTANVFVKMAPTLDGSNHAVVRYLIQFLVMLFFIKKKKLQLLGPKKSRKLLFLRGFVGSLGGILGFFSIKYLDVSDYETLTNSCVLLTALLARIFLKEKLSVCHFFATVLTITGVMFIIRPEFLFGIEVDLEDFFHVNLTQHNLNINQTFVDSHGHVQNLGILNHSTRKFTESIIGVILVLVAALCMSSAQVAIRKLSLTKVHFSVISIYPALLGLPASVLLTTVLIATKSSHKDITEEAEVLAVQIIYSAISGLFATFGLICLNLALKAEDASKIGMLKTTGVFFSFILQYLFLDVEVDFLGIFGAVCIIAGTFSIIAVKILQQKYSKSENCFFKIMTLQF